MKRCSEMLERCDLREAIHGVKKGESPYYFVRQYYVKSVKTKGE